MPKKKPEYQLKLVTSGIASETEGKTVLECLEKLESRIPKTKGIVTLLHTNLKAQLRLSPIQTRRLLAKQKPFLQIFQKRLLISLK